MQTKVGNRATVIHAALAPAFLRVMIINPMERAIRELPPKVVQQLLGHSSIRDAVICSRAAAIGL